MSKNEPSESTSAHEGALSKIDGPTALKYAKWGLMGLGGLVVVQVVAGVLLSPIGLLAAAGAGGFAWWKLGRGSSERVITPPPPEQAAVPASSPPVTAPAPAPAPAAATPAPAPAPAPPRAPAALPDFAQAELDEFDRQLAALDDDV